MCYIFLSDHDYSWFLSWHKLFKRLVFSCSFMLVNKTNNQLLKLQPNKIQFFISIDVLIPVFLCSCFFIAFSIGAAGKYHRALLYLRSLTCKNPLKSFSPEFQSIGENESEDQKLKICGLSVDCYNNLAGNFHRVASVLAMYYKAISLQVF